MGYSLVAPIEVEYAKLCIENIPCAEKVRFLKTGSSATEGAIRIARAFTGKNISFVANIMVGTNGQLLLKAFDKVALLMKYVIMCINLNTMILPH